MDALNSEFQQLMDSMAHGSEEAAWKIAELYTPHIIRAVRAKLPKEIRSKVDSLDFAQAVWASLILDRCRLAQFRTPQQFLGYLTAMARNKVIDGYRYHSVEKRNVRSEISISNMERQERAHRPIDNGPSDLPKSPDPSPSQVASVRETWNRIVNQSSKRDREIVSLRVNGMTYLEIANQLSLGEKTVRRVLGRVLEQIRS